MIAPQRALSARKRAAMAQKGATPAPARATSALFGAVIAPSRAPMAHARAVIALCRASIAHSPRKAHRLQRNAQSASGEADSGLASAGAAPWTVPAVSGDDAALFRMSSTGSGPSPNAWESD